MTVKERFKHCRPGSRLLYSARPLYLERPEALNTHSQPAPLHIERSLQKPGNVRSVAVSLRDEWRRCAPLTKAEVKASRRSEWERHDVGIGDDVFVFGR